MAIDTAAKRASATEFLIPSYAIGIFPDGAIAQNDRQSASWAYGGILADPPPVIVGAIELTLIGRLPTLRLLERSPSLIIEDRDFELELPER